MTCRKRTGRHDLSRIAGLRLLCGFFLALFVVGCGGGAPIGTIEYGELVVSGEVDGDYLYRQLIQLDPPFQACYVRMKRRDRTLEGVIDLILRGGSGRLAGEIKTNTTGNEELGECILGAISGLTIREPADSPPWNYTADWSVTFEILRLDRETN